MRSSVFRRDEGFTLSEMMVVTLLLGVIIMAAYLLMETVSGWSDRLEAQTIAAEEGRVVLDRLSRELRQAYEINENEGAFVDALPRQCTFYTDVDRNGTPDKVRYRVVNDRIYRSVASATSQMPPYTFLAFGPESVVEGALESSWTGSLFSYYDDQDPPVLLASTDQAAISAVKIRLVNSVKVGQKTASVDVTTWVKVRAVHNTID